MGKVKLFFVLWEFNINDKLHTHNLKKSINREIIFFKSVRTVYTTDNNANYPVRKSCDFAVFGLLLIFFTVRLQFIKSENDFLISESVIDWKLIRIWHRIWCLCFR